MARVQPRDARADVVGPPRALLLGAALAVACSVALFVVATFAAHVLGYVLASIVTIGLLASFTRVDNARRRLPGYVPDPRLARLGPALAVAAVAVAAAHVWYVATELAG